MKSLKILLSEVSEYIKWKNDKISLKFPISHTVKFF